MHTDTQFHAHTLELWVSLEQSFGDGYPAALRPQILKPTSKHLCLAHVPNHCPDTSKLSHGKLMPKINSNKYTYLTNNYTALTICQVQFQAFYKY